jgi:transcriptional regulator CtsR
MALTDFYENFMKEIDERKEKANSYTTDMANELISQFECIVSQINSAKV